MKPYEHVIQLRVRYSETDQMGTFYNSRVLEWFECGRTELLRHLGVPYVAMEERGVLLPVVESHVRYVGRARYDDLLRITASVEMAGRVRVRFEVRIAHDNGKGKVADGYTVHALTDPSGKPIRAPVWLVEALEKGHAIAE